MKPFYLYFFLEYKKCWRIKKNFEIALTLLKLLQFEILATRGRFPPRFLENWLPHEY